MAIGAGRAGLGWANSGQGQNRGRAKIGPVFSGQNFNSPARPKNWAGLAKKSFQGKKKFERAGPAGPYRAEQYWGGQIWPDFFRANNLMAQSDLNSRRTGPGQFFHLYLQCRDITTTMSRHQIKIAKVETQCCDIITKPHPRHKLGHRHSMSRHHIRLQHSKRNVATLEHNFSSKGTTYDVMTSQQLCRDIRSKQPRWKY